VKAPSTSRVDRITIERVLSGLPGIDEAGEARYLKLHIYRYLETLNLLPRSADELKVLDMGVASGHLAILVRRLFGYRVVGLDYQDGWRGRLSHEGIELKVCDLAREVTPFQDGAFDVVLLCETIEHLPTNPHSVLREASRVLKKNGIFIMTTPNFARLINRLKLLFGRSPLAPFSAGVGGESHIHEYTAAEVASLLTENQFQIRRLYLSDCWERTVSTLNPAGLLYKLLARGIPQFRGCIIALAEK
jgi:SAM-dependent methyltransferase